jgi:hypothetical protein
MIKYLYHRMGICVLERDLHCAEDAIEALEAQNADLTENILTLEQKFHRLCDEVDFERRLRTVEADLAKQKAKTAAQQQNGHQRNGVPPEGRPAHNQDKPITVIPNSERPKQTKTS